MKDKLIKSFFVLLFTTMVVSAQTQISGGNVSGVWTQANSPYMINGDINVDENTTLTIEPGVQVTFTGYYFFRVAGQLIAEGTSADSIYFNSVDGTNWGGIKFWKTDENNQPSSSIKYCHIEKASSGPGLFQFYGGLHYVNTDAHVSHSTFYNSMNIKVSNAGGEITDCNFRNVFSPMFLDSSATVEIRSCDFNSLGNPSIIAPAAIYAINNSEINLDSSIVRNQQNPGIYAEDCTANITNTVIQNCVVTVSGVKGGGVFFGNSVVNLKYVTLENNVSTTAGGGGYFDKTSGTFKNVIVRGNTATEDGGGLYFNAQNDWQNIYTAVLTNCLIVDNTSTGSNKRGGGVYFGTGTKCNGVFTNCTIANNNSESWGGISSSDAQPSTLLNSIVYNNGNNTEIQAGGLYTYSLIQGDYVGDDTASTNINNVDPLFRNASEGNYHLQSQSCGDFQTSPAIDAGHPAIEDFVLDCSTAGLGNKRSDMGAYGGADNWWDRSVNPPCYYTGEVSGVWDCDTIYVAGDIIVPSGETLEITSNVKKVRVLGPYQIKVEGRLIAIGSEEALPGFNDLQILFTGASWHGIFFNSINGAEEGTSVIKNCKFENADKTDMTYQGGGAINIYNSDSVTVEGCVFYGNNARLGGAMYIENSNAKVENCYFENNGIIGEEVQTESGGALYINNSEPSIRKLRFVNNYSTSGGGAMVLDNSSPTISNVLMIKNETNGLGGAVKLINGAAPKFVNVTVADNVAGTGGAFYTTESSNMNVINSILYGDTKPEIYAGGSANVEVTYTLVEEGSNEDFFGEGCLDTDPLFKMIEENYYYLKSFTCGDGEASPAIDAGHPDSTDAVIACGQGLGTVRADMGYYGGRYSMVLVGVEEEETGAIPTKYELSQNYPNPFNPTTTITYSIPSVIARSPANDGKQSIVNVALTVYNSLGQKIATLVNKEQAPGNYIVQFDASKLPSGIYFYTLRAGDFVSTKKMILMK